MRKSGPAAAKMSAKYLPVVSNKQERRAMMFGFIVILKVGIAT
jgi:hypothetical protein